MTAVFILCFLSLRHDIGNRPSEQELYLPRLFEKVDYPAIIPLSPKPKLGQVPNQLTYSLSRTYNSQSREKRKKLGKS